MIDLWKYVNAEKIRIVDVEGKEYAGMLIAVMDGDENGRNEDDITILYKGEYLGFLQSEIVKLEVIE